MSGSAGVGPTVAFLGAGTMGGPMARNVAAAGLPTRVWNRSHERAEALADVATVVDSPQEAVAGADVVVTMLFDADSVASVVEGLEVTPGTPWVQCSTVGAEGSDRLAALAERLGLVYVDAPVLGTRQPAEDGSLVVLASGEESVRPRVEPVLDAVGQRTLWVGAAGAGSRLKLACNAWVLTVVQGVAESLALTRELGLDPQLFLDAIEGSAVAAPYVGIKGAAMLAGDTTMSFALAGAVKDAGLIRRAAEDAGLDLALVPQVERAMQRGLDAGLGEEDMGATYRVL